MIWRRNGITLLLFILMPALFAIPKCYAGDYSIAILARPANLRAEKEPYGDRSPVGHTYIIVNIKTASGIKQQSYGFYPTDGGKGKIKGPGLLTAEDRCLPSDDCGKEEYASKLGQLADVVTSTTIPVSDAQLRKVYTTIENWNRKPFDLIDSNCVSFVSDVVKSIGYSAPDTRYVSPVDYVNKVRESIIAQDRVRKAEEKVKLAETRRDEANKLAELSAAERDLAIKDKKAAEERKIQAEEKSKTLEAKLRESEKNRAALEKENAKSIPPDWIQCNCPQAHAAVESKLINGVRYHKEGPKCPN